METIKQKIKEFICSIVGHDIRTLALNNKKYHITECKRCGKRWYKIRRKNYVSFK
jgi:hypothetical protein